MYKIIISLLLLLLLLSGCEKKEKNVNETKKTEQKLKHSTENNSTKAITFTLQTIDNKKLHLTEIDNGLEIQELKNRPVFLLFFGHQCPPCMREIPELIKISKTHKDLAIIAIEVQGLDKTQLQNFAKQKGINYNLITLDSSLKFVNYIQAKAEWNGAIPFLLGLNKQGKVVIIHVGGLLTSQLEQVYNESIKEVKNNKK